MSNKQHYDTKGVYCPLIQHFNPPCDVCMWAIANGKYVVCSVAAQAFGKDVVNGYILNGGVRDDE